MTGIAGEVPATPSNALAGNRAPRERCRPAVHPGTSAAPVPPALLRHGSCTSSLPRAGVSLASTTGGPDQRNQSPPEATLHRLASGGRKDSRNGRLAAAASRAVRVASMPARCARPVGRHRRGCDPPPWRAPLPQRLPRKWGVVLKNQLVGQCRERIGPYASRNSNRQRGPAACGEGGDQRAIPKWAPEPGPDAGWLAQSSHRSRVRLRAPAAIGDVGSVVDEE